MVLIPKTFHDVIYEGSAVFDPGKPLDFENYDGVVQTLYDKLKAIEKGEPVVEHTAYARYLEKEQLIESIKMNRRMWRRYRFIHAQLKAATNVIYLLGLVNASWMIASQGMSFALYIDSESGNKARLYHDIRYARYVNDLMKVAYSAAIGNFAQHAMLVMADAMYESISAYKQIADVMGTKYGNYFHGVVIAQDEVYTTIAVLPDMVEKIRLPTQFFPELAQLNSVVSVAIQQFEQPDFNEDLLKTTANVETVVDGDTIILKNGVKIRIRGMDAPEIGTPEGVIAQNKLAVLILNKDIDYYVDPLDDKDAYDRTLAWVYREGLDVAGWMLSHGYATFYRPRHNWFQAEVVKQDDNFTWIRPYIEDATIDYDLLTIPTSHIPFLAKEGTMINIRIKMSFRKTFLARVTEGFSGGYSLKILPGETKTMTVAQGIWTLPLFTVVKVIIEKYYACKTDYGANEKRIERKSQELFKTDDGKEITIPSEYIPEDIQVGDSAFILVAEEKVWKSFITKVLSTTATTTYLKSTAAPGYEFNIPKNLIPFTHEKDNEIKFEVARWDSAGWTPTLITRLGNIYDGKAVFLLQPEEITQIHIPYGLLSDIIQDPSKTKDVTKIQINDSVIFHLQDATFASSFKARLDRIEEANGIWKILPEETKEISIPSVIAEEFLTTKRYAEYPIATFSVKKLTPYAKAEQEVEVISTNANNTTLKPLHIKFGLLQFTLPTNLLAWTPVVGDLGELKISYYMGTHTGTYYVESIAGRTGSTSLSQSASAGATNLYVANTGIFASGDRILVGTGMGREERIVASVSTGYIEVTASILKNHPAGEIVTVLPVNARIRHKTKGLSTDIPGDKLPLYLKRFDVVRLRIKKHGFEADPLWFFVTVRNIDTFTGYAHCQRTDNNAWIDLPVFVLPEGTKEKDTLSLIVDKYGYRRTFFAAKFSSLALPDKCTVKVEPEYFYVFEIPFSFLPSGSKIWDIIGFELGKKTEDEVFEPNLEITNIDDPTGEITLKEIGGTKEIKLDKGLLPYVRLPAPDSDIVNLSVGDKMLLKTNKM